MVVCGVACYGLARSEVGFGKVRSGEVRRGKAGSEVGFGAVRCGRVRCGRARFGKVG